LSGDATVVGTEVTAEGRKRMQHANFEMLLADPEPAALG
jgi:hypothetical protein